MSEKVDMIEELGKHPFIKGLSTDLISRVAECADGIVHWKDDEVVFRSGGEATKCYLIRTGEVALEMHSPGAGSRIIQTVARGQVLGWSWLFPPYRWAFDARVLTPTDAMVLDGAKVREFLDAERDLGFDLIVRFGGLIAARLQATRLQLMDLYASRS
jgi:CRP-like cAMP-binding protein